MLYNIRTYKNNEKKNLYSVSDQSLQRLRTSRSQGAREGESNLYFRKQIKKRNQAKLSNLQGTRSRPNKGKSLASDWMKD